MMESRILSIVSRRRIRWEAPSWLRKLSTGLVRDYGLVLVILIMGLALSQSSDVFLTKLNILNVLYQSTITAVVAIGMTFVILGAGIDLSVGSVLAVTSVLSVGLTVWDGWPVPLAILAALGVGSGVGLFNGFAVAKLKVNPLIVTLAMLSVMQGVAFIYSGGENIAPVPNFFHQVGVATVGWNISAFIPFALGLALVAHFVLTRTRFGRSLYAVGGNPTAAALAGIRTDRILIGSYAICGFTAAIAGIMTTARLESGAATAGTNMNLNAIAATVIGGTSLFGGQGNVVGTLLGVLLIGLVGNAITLLGVPPNWDLIVTGGVIFTAAALDVYRRYYAESQLVRATRRVEAPDAFAPEEEPAVPLKAP
jgi:ribose transport system permease protein